MFGITKLGGSPKLPSGGKGFHIGFRGMVTFDKKFIKRDWSKINRTPLRRAGLLVRRIMINSIRKVKSDEQKRRDFLEGRTKRFRKSKPSKPGSPPRSRYRGHPFRLIYSVPFLDSSVMIGHVGFKGGRKTAMSIHEFGQRVKIRSFVYKKRRTRRRQSLAQKRARAAAFAEGNITQQRPAQVVTRFVQMPKRPFARPALDKASPRISTFWRNSIKGRGVVRN